MINFLIWICQKISIWQKNIFNYAYTLGILRTFEIEGFIMNFYIGNSIDEINKQEYNVEFNDELIGFIYKLSEKVPFDMHKLYEINPYDDVKISKDDLEHIIQICNYILDNELLRGYEERDEGNQALKALLELAQKALLRGLGLISVGD